MATSPDGLFTAIYVPDFEISYIFISNLIASAMTLFLLGRRYMETNYHFDRELWRRMMRYGLPVMIAGIAYTVNEVFDRIMLSELLPQDIAKSEIGEIFCLLQAGPVHDPLCHRVQAGYRTLLFQSFEF